MSQPAHSASAAILSTLPRVASINLCADQLVLLLAEKQQILSLSNLSHETAGSYYVKRARDFPVNKGRVEEILAVQPDVVIVGEYTNPYTVRMLESLDLRVESLPIAKSIEAVLGNIEIVGSWLGRDRQAANLIASLRERLAAIVQDPGEAPRAVVYDPNGYTVGHDSMRGQLLHLSGWHNVAVEAGVISYGVLALETLIRLQPDVIVESPYSPGAFSRAQQLLNHPALKKSHLAPRIIQVPSAQTICGGPWTIDLIEQLRDQRREFQRHNHTISDKGNFDNS